jgi:hypothetical protein
MKISVLLFRREKRHALFISEPGYLIPPNHRVSRLPFLSFGGRLIFAIFPGFTKDSVLDEVRIQVRMK